jgi:hypothetical protein
VNTVTDPTEPGAQLIAEFRSVAVPLNGNAPVAPTARGANAGLVPLARFAGPVQPLAESADAGHERAWRFAAAAMLAKWVALDAPAREVFESVVFWGRTTAETAALLHRSESEVDGVYRAAIEKLRAEARPHDFRQAVWSLIELARANPRVTSTVAVLRELSA